jgi:hypothetical protein
MNNMILLIIFVQVVMTASVIYQLMALDLPLVPAGGGQALPRVPLGG